MGNSEAIRSLLFDALQICETYGSNLLTQDLKADIHCALGATANKMNNAGSYWRYSTAFLENRLQMEKQYPNGDIRLADAYNEHGIAQMMSKEYYEADDCFDVAIRMYVTQPNFKNDMNTVTRANIGFAVWLEGSNLPRAVVVFQLAIQDRQERFGFLDNKSFW